MNAFDLMAKISLDSTDYEKGLDDAEKQGEKKGHSIASKIGSGLKKGVATVAKAGAVLGTAVISGVVAIAKVGESYNEEMEKYTTNFETMLGDEAKAVQKVAELKKFASSTPLSMADLAQGTQTLLAFGVANEESTTRLRELGDIALGDSAKMQSLATSFGKATAQGKLNGEVVQSMISAGWNPLVEITKMTGESMEQVQKRMSEGKISAEELGNAMKHATTPSISELDKQLKEGKITLEQYEEQMKHASEEGGQFAGGMEKASHTIIGLKSTLSDNIKALAGLVSGQLTDAMKNDLLPTALDTVANLTTAFEKEGSGLLDGLVAITSGASKFISNNATSIVSGFSTAVRIVNSTVGTLFNSLGDVFGGITKSFNIMSKTFGTGSFDIEKAFGKINNAITFAGKLGSRVIVGLTRVFASWGKSLKPLGKAIADTFNKLKKGTKDNEKPSKSFLKSVTQGFKDFSKSSGDAITKVVNGILQFKKSAETEGTPINNIITGIGTAFTTLSTYANSAKEKISTFWTKLKKDAETEGTPVSNTLDKMSKGWDNFKNVAGYAVDKAKGLFTGLRTQAETEGTPINTAITTIKDGIGKLGEKVNEWTQPIKDFFSNIGSDGKQSGDDVSGAWDNVYGAIDSIVGCINTWVEEVVKFYASLFEESNGTASTVELAWTTVVNIIGTVKHTIEVLVDAVVKKFGNAGKASDDFKGKSITMSAVLSTVFALLKWTIDTTLQAINDALVVINDLLNGDFAKAWTDTKQLVGDFWTNLSNLANTYAPGVTGILSGIASAVGAISKAIETAVGWINTWNNTMMQNKEAKVTTMHTSTTGSGESYGGGHSRKFAKAYDNPYLLDTATVFGKSGNDWLIGGDLGHKNGGELIYSRNKLMNDIRQATGDSRSSEAILQYLLGGGIVKDVVKAIEGTSMKYDEREIARVVRKYA